MKFYLNEQGLRRVSANGADVFWLGEDGSWYREYTPCHVVPAKIESQYTGLVPEAPEEALIAPWAGPGDNSPSEEATGNQNYPYLTPEQYVAKRAGRNL